MNQKDGVFGAVRAVFTEGMVPATGAWTKEQSERVTQLVFMGFKDGTIEYRGGIPEDAKLMKYIPGLVNNWVRKDGRLNGGVKYSTKNPGSRAGSGDETLKAMRSLLALQSDPTVKVEIQKAIDERIAQLKPKVEVNVAALPEALRHLVKVA